MVRRTFLGLLLAATLLCMGCRCTRDPAQPPCPPPDRGGLLLETGALQLGPGLGRSAYRGRGDGQGRLE